MKQILLMRHGKSDWSNPELEDFDRPLKKRGRKDSLLMGGLLKENELLPDIVLCSTALRARETLSKLQEVAPLKTEVLFYDTFYYEGTQAILDALKKLPKHVNRALVIGHNPTMESLIAGVFNMEAFEIKMSTAAIASVISDLEQWGALQWDKSKLEWIMKPKDYK